MDAMNPLFHYFLQCLGGILNRFSKDIAILDDLLPLTIFDFIQVCKNQMYIVWMFSEGETTFHEDQIKIIIRRNKKM